MLSHFVIAVATALIFLVVRSVSRKEPYCIDESMCIQHRSIRSTNNEQPPNPELATKLFSADVQSKNAAVDRRELDSGGNRAPSLIIVHLWPGGKVMYRVDPLMNNDEKCSIWLAMNALSTESDGCVHFECALDDSKIYVNISKDESDVCESRWIGRYLTANGVNELTLGVNGGCFRHTTLLHELLHVLGFFHEHQRNDRDDYVEINTRNLLYLDYKEKDFDKGGAKLNEIAGEEYDYESILHYPNEAARLPIFKVLKNPEMESRLGHYFMHGTYQTPLSPLDRKKLKAAYCNVATEDMLDLSKPKEQDRTGCGDKPPLIKLEWFSTQQFIENYRETLDKIEREVIKTYMATCEQAFYNKDKQWFYQRISDGVLSTLDYRYTMIVFIGNLFKDESVEKSVYWRDVRHISPGSWIFGPQDFAYYSVNSNSPTNTLAGFLQAGILVVLQSRPSAYLIPKNCCSIFGRAKIMQNTSTAYEMADKLDRSWSWNDFRRNRKIFPSYFWSVVRVSNDSAVWDSDTDRCMCSQSAVDHRDNQTYRWFAWETLFVNYTQIKSVDFKFKRSLLSTYRINSEEQFRYQLAADIAFKKSTEIDEEKLYQRIAQAVADSRNRLVVDVIVFVGKMGLYPNDLRHWEAAVKLFAGNFDTHVIQFEYYKTEDNDQIEMLAIHQRRPIAVRIDRKCDCEQAVNAIENIMQKDPQNIKTESIMQALNQQDSVPDWSIIKIDGAYGFNDSAQSDRCLCKYAQWIFWRSIYPKDTVPVTVELVLKNSMGFDEGKSFGDTDLNDNGWNFSWSESAEPKRKELKSAAASAYVSAITSTTTPERNVSLWLHEQIADAMISKLDVDDDLLLIAGNLNLNSGEFHKYGNRLTVYFGILDFEYFEFNVGQVQVYMQYTKKAQIIGQNLNCNCEQIKAIVSERWQQMVAEGSTKRQTDLGLYIVRAVRDATGFDDWSCLHAFATSFVRDSNKDRRCFCSYQYTDDVDGKQYRWYVWRNNDDMWQEKYAKATYLKFENTKLEHSYSTTDDNKEHNFGCQRKCTEDMKCVGYMQRDLCHLYSADAPKYNLSPDQQGYRRSAYIKMLRFINVNVQQFAPLAMPDDRTDDPRDCLRWAADYWKKGARAIIHDSKNRTCQYMKPNAVDITYKLAPMDGLLVFVAAELKVDLASTYLMLHDAQLSNHYDQIVLPRLACQEKCTEDPECMTYQHFQLLSKCQLYSSKYGVTKQAGFIANVKLRKFADLRVESMQQLTEIDDAETVDSADKCVEKLADYWEKYSARATTYDSTDSSCRFFKPTNSDNTYSLMMQPAMTSYVTAQMEQSCCEKCVCGM